MPRLSLKQQGLVNTVATIRKNPERWFGTHVSCHCDDTGINHVVWYGYYEIKTFVGSERPKLDPAKVWALWMRGYLAGDSESYRNTCGIPGCISCGTFEARKTSNTALPKTRVEKEQKIMELTNQKKKGDGGTLVERKDVLDRWYTHDTVATRLFTTFKSFAKDVDLYIEPSAGSGSFFSTFPEGKRKGYEIEPSEEGHPEIQKADFYEVASSDHEGEGIVAYVGNPPFGKMATEAIKFFNTCAANPRAKYIGFIVPKTFQKVSVQNQLSLEFMLIHDENLPYNSFTLFDEEKGVPSCFQIWMRTKSFQRKKVELPENIWFEEVEKEVAEKATDGVYFAIRRAGGLAGCMLEGLDHSKASTLFFKERIRGVREALEEMIFLSTAEKTAGTRSVSKSEFILFLSTISLNQEV